jgi:hypothetical protein
MPYVEPATFLFWRFAGVLMAIAAFSLLWRITWPSRSQIKHIAVAGLLLQFGYLLGVWFAVRLGMTAGLVAIIVGLQPILTAWFAAWISEKVSPRQWIGLGFGFAGVALVAAAEELPSPLHLPIRGRLNGTVMQESNTSQMIFDVPALIEFLSADTTLPAGSIILTGTPHGVGMARHPPVWLQPGDTIEIEIGGIGTLSNPVVEGAP